MGTERERRREREGEGREREREREREQAIQTAFVRADEADEVLY